jgi:hypothetical protein
MLYQVAEKFAGIDLHPETVSNTEMGTVFEDLIRKFAEISNENCRRALHSPPTHPPHGQPALRRG